MEISAKKITKFLLKIILGLVCLLALLIILLRIPAVQTKIAAKLTSILSKQLKTQIDIQAVAINFVDNATIKGIYIEDLKNDTMLYAGNLVVDIGFIKLLSSEIIIESLKLENAVVNVSQNQDSVFNFQFLIDRLSKPDTTAKTDSKPINFRIDQVQLKNIRANADLLSGKHQLSLTELELDINSTDLNNKKFDIKSIDIVGLQLQSRLKKQKVVSQTKSKGVFPLKGLPISLKVGEINITESNISYRNGDALLSKYFDPDNINAKSINIAINDIQLDSLGISAKINELALNLNNRIDLKSIQGKLRFDDHAASINDFSFNTAASKGKMSIQISYPTFADLIKSLDSANADLQMDSISISIPDIAYFVPQLDTISTIKPFKNQLLSLDGNASGNLAEMDINYINAAISQTSVKLEGTIFNLTDINNLNVLDGLLSGQSNIDDLKKIVDVRKFGSDINQFGNVSFQALFSGSLKSLDLGDFNLFTEGKLQAQLSGNIKNINKPDLIKYDLKIYNLATGYKDLHVFIDSLPQLATEIKDLRYTGSISGTKTEYKLNGKFATTVGDIATNIQMAFNKEFSNASYKGKIALKDFNLRQLLQNDSLGKVTLNASVDGSGLSIDQLKTSLKLKVDRFDFNSYSYNNLNVFGNVDKKEFEGKIRMNDKNIVFNFNGLVNLNDSLPVLNFDAKIDTLDLYALHLLSYPLKMQMSINANMLGSTPDNVEGSLKMSNILLQNPDKKWRADSITFTATTKSPKNRTLLLDAPFAKMEVSGNYKVANLGKIIINFADQYFPFSNLIGGKQVADVLPPTKEQEIRDEKINFNLSVIDPTALASMFKIDLKKLDSARVNFTLDAPEKLLDFHLYIPEIEYAGIYADSIYGQADNTGNKLVALFGVDSIRLTETISIPSLSLEAAMSEKQSVFKLLVEGDSSGYNLGLTTKLTAPNGDILLEFQNPLYLKGTEWSITQSKPFNLSKIERAIPLFTIASNG
ncbi:MAG: hypothetical protein ABIV51_09300, partial [Saprospiraceae bacterium]